VCLLVVDEWDGVNPQRETVLNDTHAIELGLCWS
jgi:hypothetical protein